MLCTVVHALSRVFDSIRALSLPPRRPMLAPVLRYGNGIRRGFAWLGFLSIINEALFIKASSRDFYIESALPAFEPLPSRSRPAPDSSCSCAQIPVHPRSFSLTLVPTLWRLGNQP